VGDNKKKEKRVGKEKEEVRRRRQKREREAYEVVLSVRLEVNGCINVPGRKSSSRDEVV
jgi:hypothetical protein